MNIGVLAIQGDFAAHARMLARIGVVPIEVRKATELARADALIIPGGESTTMLNFIQEEGLAAHLRSFAAAGRPILGTCAGAILLAREVYSPSQASLALIDIRVERNGYGRQVDSFIGSIDTDLAGGRMEAVFIRAPRIMRTGPDVRALAVLDAEPVLVQQANVMAATFHPELSDDERVHRRLARMARPRDNVRRQAAVRRSIASSIRDPERRESS